MKRLTVCSAVVVLGVAAFAALALAHAPAGVFVVTPMGGYGRIEKASALDPRVSGGLDAMYRHSSGFMVGIGGNAARTKTAANFFPPRA